MKTLLVKVQWMVAVVCAFLSLIIGTVPVQAATVVGQSHFDVTHKKGTSASSNTTSVNPNVVLGDGTGCGGVVNNTGWKDVYSSDGTAKLSLCSFDDGYHIMETWVRVFNFYGDGIMNAYALATYDDGGEDGNSQDGDGAVQVNLDVTHTFLKGGYHTVTIQGGFTGYESEGHWEVSQSLSLN